MAFYIYYGGEARNGNTYIPHKAVAHTADEAIAVINTWRTYGRKNSGEYIIVNERTEGKIRRLFRDGLGTHRWEEMRTTGCGAWSIVFMPALADTLEEHLRIMHEQREVAREMRMAQAKAVKELRLKNLNEQRRGWYHVELEICLQVFSNNGNDYRTKKTFSGNIIADSGADAYNKAVAHIESHPEEVEHNGNVAILETVAEATSHGYEFTFLGVKTDEGYSVEKWQEWHDVGEI